MTVQKEIMSSTVIKIRYFLLSIVEVFRYLRIRKKYSYKIIQLKIHLFLSISYGVLLNILLYFK